MGRHVLDPDVFRSPDSNAVVSDESEAPAVAMTAAAFILLSTTISVNGQVAHGDISSDAWDGGGGASDHNDGAIGTIRQTQNLMGSRSSNFYTVTIDDDRFAHWKKRWPEDYDPAFGWQSLNSSGDGGVIP